MGMFDYINCSILFDNPKWNGLEFQTKNTPSQSLDLYEIRTDGTLWHLEYDTEIWKIDSFIEMVGVKMGNLENLYG